MGAISIKLLEILKYFLSSEKVQKKLLKGRKIIEFILKLQKPLQIFKASPNK
jgi:hypothetical protein